MTNQLNEMTTEELHTLYCATKSRDEQDAILKELAKRPKVEMS